MAAELEGWDDDELENGLGRGITSDCFARILKRLHNTCIELSGSVAFQASTLAAVTSLDFVSIPYDIKQINAASTRSGISRDSGSPPSWKGNIDDHTEAVNVRSIAAGKPY